MFEAELLFIVFTSLFAIFYNTHFCSRRYTIANVTARPHAFFANDRAQGRFYDNRMANVQLRIPRQTYNAIVPRGARPGSARANEAVRDYIANQYNVALSTNPQGDQRLIVHADVVTSYANLPATQRHQVGRVNVPAHQQQRYAGNPITVTFSPNISQDNPPRQRTLYRINIEAPDYRESINTDIAFSNAVLRALKEVLRRYAFTGFRLFFNTDSNASGVAASMSFPFGRGVRQEQFLDQLRMLVATLNTDENQNSGLSMGHHASVTGLLSNARVVFTNMDAAAVFNPIRANRAMRGRALSNHVLKRAMADLMKREDKMMQTTSKMHVRMRYKEAGLEFSETQFVVDTRVWLTHFDKHDTEFPQHDLPFWANQCGFYCLYDAFLALTTISQGTIMPTGFFERDEKERWIFGRNLGFSQYKGELVPKSALKTLRNAVDLNAVFFEGISMNEMMEMFGNIFKYQGCADERGEYCKSFVFATGHFNQGNPQFHNFYNPDTKSIYAKEAVFKLAQSTKRVIVLTLFEDVQHWVFSDTFFKFSNFVDQPPMLKSLMLQTKKDCRVPSDKKPAKPYNISCSNCPRKFNRAVNFNAHKCKRSFGRGVLKPAHYDKNIERGDMIIETASSTTPPPEDEPMSAQEFDSLCAEVASLHEEAIIENPTKDMLASNLKKGKPSSEFIITEAAVAGIYDEGNVEGQEVEDKNVNDTDEHVEDYYEIDLEAEKEAAKFEAVLQRRENRDDARRKRRRNRRRREVERARKRRRKNDSTESSSETESSDSESEESSSSEEDEVTPPPSPPSPPPQKPYTPKLRSKFYYDLETRLGSQRHCFQTRVDDIMCCYHGVKKTGEVITRTFLTDMQRLAECEEKAQELFLYRNKLLLDKYFAALTSFQNGTRKTQPSMPQIVSRDWAQCLQYELIKERNVMSCDLFVEHIHQYWAQNVEEFELDKGNPNEIDCKYDKINFMAHKGSDFDAALVYKAFIRRASVPVKDKYSWIRHKPDMADPAPLYHTDVHWMPRLSVKKNTKIAKMTYGEVCFSDTFSVLQGALKNLCRDYKVETLKDEDLRHHLTQEAIEYILKAYDRPITPEAQVAPLDILLLDNEDTKTHADYGHLIYTRFPDMGEALINYCINDCKALCQVYTKHEETIGDLLYKLLDETTNKPYKTRAKLCAALINRKLTCASQSLFFMKSLLPKYLYEKFFESAKLVHRRVVRDWANAANIGGLSICNSPGIHGLFGDDEKVTVLDVKSQYPNAELKGVIGVDEWVEIPIRSEGHPIYNNPDDPGFTFELLNDQCSCYRIHHDTIIRRLRWPADLDHCGYTSSRPKPVGLVQISDVRFNTKLRFNPIPVIPYSISKTGKRIKIPSYDYYAAETDLDDVLTYSFLDVDTLLKTGASFILRGLQLALDCGHGFTYFGPSQGALYRIKQEQDVLKEAGSPDYAPTIRQTAKIMINSVHGSLGVRHPYSESVCYPNPGAVPECYSSVKMTYHDVFTGLTLFNAAKPITETANYIAILIPAYGRKMIYEAALALRDHIKEETGYDNRLGNILQLETDSLFIKGPLPQSWLDEFGGEELGQFGYEVRNAMSIHISKKVYAVFDWTGEYKDKPEMRPVFKDATDFYNFMFEHGPTKTADMFKVLKIAIKGFSKKNHCLAALFSAWMGRSYACKFESFRCMGFAKALNFNPELINEQQVIRRIYPPPVTSPQFETQHKRIQDCGHLIKFKKCLPPVQVLKTYLINRQEVYKKPTPFFNPHKMGLGREFGHISAPTVPQQHEINNDIPTREIRVNVRHRDFSDNEDEGDDFDADNICDYDLDYDFV